ncbi:LPS export ABC transporter permease LptG [Haliea sp. AH-315-K21]|nr:LPS export ABC transporter permease LptG [Haliea sp. AH-315-K21]
MRKFDAYIRNSVLMAMLLVLLVLAGLDFLFTVFDELGGTNERYQTSDALQYVLLTFPRHVYDLLPMTALMGSLIGLSVLASSNELVVMQAAGVKTGRIVWAVMKPAILVMVIGLILGEFVTPPLDLRAEVNKTVASSDEVILSNLGRWQRDGNDFLHFNAIEPEGVLHGVSIYSFNDEQKLTENIIAESARYQDGSWLLEDVRRTLFTQSEEGLLSELQVLPELGWDVDLSPELLQLMIVDSDSLSISDLYRYARRSKEQGQDANAYLMDFWEKALQPLATAVLVLVAISFIFGPLREATMGSRVFTAVSFGLLFIILQQLFSTVGLVYQLNPFLAVLTPILMSGCLGVYLLKVSE